MKSTIQPATASNTLRVMFCAAAVSAAFTVIGSAQSPGKKAGPAAAEQSYEIEKYSLRRYATTIASSAFESDLLPPEIIREEEEKKEPFEFKLVSVTGNTGSYRATVVDKKGQYIVVSQQANKKTGYYLADIKPSANIKDVQVKVGNGGQTEWVEFDEARFKVAAKGRKAPVNTKKRTSIVPNIRKGPSGRAPIPKSKTTKEINAKAGANAKAAIEKANAAAVEKAKSSSRSNGRRVVLPPKDR